MSLEKIIQTMRRRQPSEISAPEVLENLVRLAERAGASDIHLQMRGKSAEVCFRLDGIMTPARELPRKLPSAFLAASNFSRGSRPTRNRCRRTGALTRRLEMPKRHPRRHISDRDRRKNRPAPVQFNHAPNPWMKLCLPKRRADELERFPAPDQRTVVAHRPGGQRQDHHHLRLPAAAGRTRRTPRHHRRRPG